MSGRRATAIAILITAASWCAATSAHAADAPAALHVSVAVCDADHLPPELIDVAERIAGEVYREIGITIDWVDSACGGDDRGLSVNVISRQTCGAAVSDLTLGFAGSGSSAATVLYDRVEAFAHHYHVRREVLLGYVMAHELGHLLLPPNSHSLEGVMRASIDLELAAARRLRFTPQQGELIVRKIEGVSVATH